MKTLLRIINSKPVVIVGGLLTLAWIVTAIVRAYRAKACLDPYQGYDSRKAYCEDMWADWRANKLFYGNAQRDLIQKNCAGCIEFKE